MKKFKTPKKTLGDLDAATVAQLVSASSDLALVIDRKGIIRDVSLESDDLSEYGCEDWVGSSWADVVTTESRPKVEAMLEAAYSSGASNWRQINHHSNGHNTDLPIRYTAVFLPKSERVLAIGQDLRPLSSMQQRLIATQAQMENEYARFRLAETRYQALFQLSSEAILIVNEADLRIAEANPAAAELLKVEPSRLVGRDFTDLIANGSVATVQKLFAKLRTSPRSEDIRVKFARSNEDFTFTASIFRNGSATHYLVRFNEQGNDPRAESGDTTKDALTSVIYKMPDAFVVLDQDRTIATANAAFLDLAQLAEVDQARGQKIERWLGRVDVDIDILIANLREYGSLRRFPTLVRGEFGSREEVELSGVAILEHTPQFYGLSIRRPQPRLSGLPMVQPTGVRSFEQLKELVGQVPLRDLVRETTDIIEQMCIEAALELTGDNRASAAEMLGLSRQSLYVKLRRHGLGELDSYENS